MWPRITRGRYCLDDSHERRIGSLFRISLGGAFLAAHFYINAFFLPCWDPPSSALVFR